MDLPRLRLPAPRCWSSGGYRDVQSGTVDATYTAKGCSGSGRDHRERNRFEQPNLTATGTVTVAQAAIGSIPFDVSHAGHRLD